MATAKRGMPRAAPAKKDSGRASAEASAAIVSAQTEAEVRAWTAFLHAIESARTELGYQTWHDEYECYFRGQRDDRWGLAPSLLRSRKGGHLSDAEQEQLSELEYNLYYEFRARARELHSSLSSSWDVLFAMQHYGLPTRLLDWSEVLSCAIYFALDRWKEDGEGLPCVWVLNPYEMNAWSDWKQRDLIAPQYLGYDSDSDETWTYEELLIDGGDMDFDRPTAIYPEFKNDRIEAQQGSFTIHGDKLAPLEAQLPKKNRILRKVVIEREAVPAARRFLKHAGVDRRTLFPDLASLAESLCEKYGIAKRQS